MIEPAGRWMSKSDRTLGMVVKNQERAKKNKTALDYKELLVVAEYKVACRNFWSGRSYGAETLEFLEHRYVTLVRERP